MPHTAAIPSNIFEDNDGIMSDDDFSGDVQMSSDSEDIQENYQVVDDEHNEADSDSNIDISFEDLMAHDEDNVYENDRAQNMPIAMDQVHIYILICNILV